MKGAVAAGHQLTAESAAEVLRAGGNAIDAAVAGFFTACVCEPVLVSPGGGGFMLARNSEGRAALFDFFTHTPRSRELWSQLDFFPVTVDFGGVEQEFHIGWGTCAVPGAIAGIFAAHDQLGRMPMRELAQPAVAQAATGVAVTDFQTSLLDVVHPIYSTESALSLFASPTQPGKLMQPGDIFHNPHLADVIDAVSREGADLFYRGELAQRIVQSCEEGGGYLTRADLDQYTVHSRTPLQVEYHGSRLASNPAPGAGGLLIGFGLEMLDHIDIDRASFGSERHLRSLIETLVSTTAARVECFTGGPSESILDPGLLAIYREQVAHRTRAWRGTTHISVIDAERNAVSLTLSNGEGCGYLLPGSGFMINNMLGEEDVNPAGFHRWNTDERMSSMMAPSLLQAGDGTLTALGSGGSNRIRTAILQVIVNLVDFGMSVEEAVESPRLHIERDALRMEAGFPDDVVSDISRNFTDCRVFEGRNIYFGGVHAVQMNKNGEFVAHGDPRRGGEGIVV